MPEFERRIPPGEVLERSVCRDCGFVAYENPKVIVGSVVSLEERVLLCRRAIPPREGFWTLPAGYLELGETVEAGAAREAAEEAGAAIVTDGVLGLYSVPRISQVQVIFRARFADPARRPLFAAGAESLEVGLFAWRDIPWDTIAFPTVRWSLELWRRAEAGPLGAPSSGPPEGFS